MRALLLIALAFSSVQPVAGSPRQEQEPVEPTETQRRRVAVTLNYCRASLSRIRRYPSKRVLIEERERILNNLDLNAIRDEEVVNLYSAVLDEINQTQVLDTERQVLGERSRRNVQRKLGGDLFVIGAHIATGQLGNAIQSGTNSWWDYRNSEIERDTQSWALERTRITGIVERSSRFLDAAWKLSRRNNIPDSWLVRTDDLIRLQTAMREPNHEVRLRVLNRMSRFMECYPPYWYYVARTQQQLGQLKNAAKTYTRLSELGEGHFRKDDMLASGTANLAMIQEFSGDKTALASAEKALEYSTDSWEVNLSCAWVLNRHQQQAGAEDAILRNLDVELEQHQSSIALVSLYYHSKDTKKLARVLADERVVARIPIPGLLLSSTVLPTDQFPLAAKRRIVSSLNINVDRRLGRETLVLRSAPDWKLGDARIALHIGETELAAPRVLTTQRGTEVRFMGASRLETPDSHDTAEDISLSLEYPDSAKIVLHLEAFARNGVRPALDLIRSGTAADGFRISTVEIGKKRLSMLPDAPQRQ